MPTKITHRVFSSQRPTGAFRCGLGPMTTHLCLILFAVLLTNSEANGHEFEDGFVERAMAVVVRDNVATLQYSIGLNPNTRQQLIKFWQSTQAAEPGTEIDQVENAQSEAKEVDFYQLAAEHLSRRLEILVNKHRVQPQLISTLQSSKHHVDVTVTLEFTLPAANTNIAVDIADRNFFRNSAAPQRIATEPVAPHSGSAKPQKTVRPAHLLPAPFGGGFRYAFKTRGSTVLNSSNVASILIRADRRIDYDLTDADLDIAFSIKAKVSNISATRANQSP